MRALKILVVVMGVLIIAGTATLVVLVVQRAGRALPAASVAPVAATLDAGGEGPVVQMTLGQPRASRIGGLAAGADGRVVVWVVRPDGERLVVLDTRTGRTVGEVRLGD